MTVNYSAVGSSAGIAAFTAAARRFRRLRRADDRRRAGRRPRRPVRPSARGPRRRIIVYNLFGLPRLHLTGPVIARIFLGQITNWRDPAITALNPGVDIPDEPITVVHRSDGSGTTYIFSDYLSIVNPAWAAAVGPASLHWPVGTGADGNPGVATAVAHIPFSIGYVERSYSKGPVLAYAAIRNRAGNYTIPSNASIAADAARKPAITPTDFSIVNEPAQDSYPICGYSWALIYTRQPSQATGQALIGLLDWLTHAGQAYAAAPGYVPLPARIQALAHTMLQQVTGPHGHTLPGLTAAGSPGPPGAHANREITSRVGFEFP